MSYLVDQEEFRSTTLNAADAICDHVFNLLGYTDLHLGTTIDWHRDPVSGRKPSRKAWYKINFLDYSKTGDAKVIWELNRHQHLVTLAKAYGLTHDEKYLCELASQWYDWQKNNPYPFGINWASSLEVAFRALSWIWIKELLVGMPGVSIAFLNEVEQAIAASAAHIERYLSTYFSPNTHLLGEGVALFFAGLLCRAKEASRWQEKGWQIVLRHAEDKVQKDGFYFEQSTYYHVYALDFFLHARILAKCNSIAIPKAFDRTIKQMLEALQKLSACGPPPRFGDDDGGRLFDGTRNQSGHLLDPLVLGSALFLRPDWKAIHPQITEETIWLLGLNGARTFDHLPIAENAFVSTALMSAGLFILRESEDSMLTMDCGAQGVGGGGHSHADALSIQLSVAGREVLTDAGTCTYVSAGEDRRYFRGTAAHNTLQVDELDQMEARGPFPWASAAAVSVDTWVEGQWFTLLACRQRGYERLVESVVHRRMVFHRPASFWFVFDLAEGHDVHGLKLHWRLRPGLRWSIDEGLLLALNEEGNPVTRLIVPGKCGWHVKVDRMPHSSVYGRREAAEVLQFSQSVALPAGFATLLQSGIHAAGHLESLHDESPQTPVRVYRFDADHAVHWMFVATRRQRWQWEVLASDAEFFYYEEKRSGNRCFITSGGTHVEVDSCSLLPSDSPMKCWSWSDDPITGAATDWVPSEPGLQKLSASLGGQLNSVGRI